MTQHAQHIISDVVATLAGRVIDIRVREAQAERELAKAMRQSFEAGVPLDALSAASGLTVEQVAAAIERDVTDSELLQLAGLC